MEFVGKIFHLIDFIIAYIAGFVNMLEYILVLLFFEGCGIMKLGGCNSE